jgi:hypothetical protein
MKTFSSHGKGNTPAVAHTEVSCTGMGGLHPARAYFPLKGLSHRRGRAGIPRRARPYRGAAPGLTHSNHKRLLVRVDGDVTTPHLSFRTVHASFQRTRLLVDIWAFTPMGPVMHLMAGPVNYLKVLPPVIRVIPVHMMNMNFIGDF